MPVIPGNQAYSLTGQQIANQLKANPEFYNVLGGAAGYTAEPMLTVLNEVMSRILDENMPWKWNRKVIPPFLTNSLQQDYVTNLTDIGWLEDAWRVDINNSTSNANRGPKPTFGLRTVRDIPQVSVQGVPFDVCFIPNSYAIMGQWQANTSYSCGYGVSMTPTSPIQQFIDENGNILFIDSTQLGLTIESPGYVGNTITPPGFFPYGVSGSVQPSAPPNATPGTLVQDGSVIWTVADSINGYAIRLSPLPAINGLCWWITTRYQVLPPTIPTLQTPLDPIPVSMMFLFRAGCRALLKQHNGSKDAPQAYAEWEEQLTKSVRGADRQTEDFTMIPTVSPMAGPGEWGAWAGGIGAAWPFGPNPGGTA